MDADERGSKPMHIAHPGLSDDVKEELQMGREFMAKYREIFTALAMS